MARTPISQQQLRPLAPRPASGPGLSPLSAQPDDASQHEIFDDCAAVTPVTMGDEPYRTLGQRFDNPSRHLTIEQVVDTRLCVSSLTPQQCKQVLGELDDAQIKNAVYDRALCFPNEPWTQKIRLMYGQQVQQHNQKVISFENILDQIGRVLETAWRQVYIFNEEDFNSIGVIVKSFLSPSMDNIGVYGTYSNYTETKINALAALLRIGKIITEIPILISQRGAALFAYDPLSRAVGNILSTTTTDEARRQVFDPTMEAEFMELNKQATTVGLFPGLLSALTSDSGAYPYSVPHGAELMPNRNKRVSTGQLAPAAKRSKSSHGDQHLAQAAVDRQGAPTPGSSRASSHQPRGVTEGWGTKPSGSRNPFSRPPSAGLVLTPPFATSANSTPSAKIKIEDEHAAEEQIDPSLRALSQGAELQVLAQGATEYQPESQGVQQAVEDPQVQKDQANDSHEGSNPGAEAPQPVNVEEQQPQGAQPQAQPQQTSQAIAKREVDKPAYDELLRRIETEVFFAHTSEPPEEQLRRAPATVALVEGTAGTILRLFQGAARATGQSGRRDLFLSSLNDTAFALLWILESCATNVGCTPLAAEVSRTLSRDALVGALWGAVRSASAKECLDLLDVKDHVGAETFGEKLGRIIRRMEETGVVGFGDLRFVLGNMRSGISVPASNPPSQPGPKST